MTCSIRETWRGWRNTCHDPGELLIPSDSRFERELPGIWWQSASVNTSQVVNKSIDFTRPAWWIGSWFKVVFPLFELFWMLVLNWKCFPINCFDSVENYKISTYTLLLVYILFFFSYVYHGLSINTMLNPFSVLTNPLKKARFSPFNWSDLIANWMQFNRLFPRLHTAKLQDPFHQCGLNGFCAQYLRDALKAKSLDAKNPCKYPSFIRKIHPPSWQFSMQFDLILRCSRNHFFFYDAPTGIVGGELVMKRL